MEEVIISNPKLEELKAKIKEGGVGQLHILADFDRTLIKAFADGKSVPSMLYILYNENHLTPDYGPRAQALHDKYHAIELDPNVSYADKKKAMYEWWTKHFSLLIESGLNKKDLKTIVGSKKVQFRDGFREFNQILKSKNIPLVIISSGGLGGEPIKMFLQKERELNDNLCIISNSFEWDKDGRAVSVKTPVIYGMNKDETAIEEFPEIFNKIKDRKNIILLGDSIDDVGMAKGVKYDNIIKVGFLNDKVEENIENYKKVFDVVITNDGSLDFINNLLKEII